MPISTWRDHTSSRIPEQSSLKVAFAFTFYKDFESSHFRGNGPNDATGCLAPASPGSAGAGASDGPTASAADRCGGPANTNFAFTDTFLASLSHGKLSLALTLLIQNDFKYAFPSDVLTPASGVPGGRVDTTWGIVAVGYKVRPRWGVSAGISSLQPALDSRYRYPRFPFWDLSGANANNYSQVFIGVNGTI